MAMRSATVFLQTGRTVLLVPPPPLTHGQRAGSKKPRGGLDAALPNGFHQAQTMVVGVLHFTHEVEITAGSNHGATILIAARCPALPPAGQPSLSASSDSHTSTPLGGNDVPFQFQIFGGGSV